MTTAEGSRMNVMNVLILSGCEAYATARDSKRWQGSRTHRSSEKIHLTGVSLLLPTLKTPPPPKKRARDEYLRTSRRRWSPCYSGHEALLGE